jgi:hypothetical protein
LDESGGSCSAEVAAALAMASAASFHRLCQSEPPVCAFTCTMSCKSISGRVRAF